MLYDAAAHFPSANSNSASPLSTTFRLTYQTLPSRPDPLLQKLSSDATSSVAEAEREFESNGKGTGLR